ncbi:hypothetical protein GY662_22255, partial [Escherichia marmotae]|uniref:hypothetical protein n=1 Tax=Escherichia marmotae TaxID=1499973 RepID=UPI0015B872D5
EDERLPYPVFEPLSQDDDYENLAQLRYAAGYVHENAPDAAERDAFGAWSSADKAVEAYVRSWLADNYEHLLTEWELDESDVVTALEEYDLADDVE